MFDEVIEVIENKKEFLHIWRDPNIIIVLQSKRNRKFQPAVHYLNASHAQLLMRQLLETCIHGFSQRSDFGILFVV